MKGLTTLFLGSLLWACPICDLLAMSLVPLATAWSIWRWGTGWPRPIARWLACRPRRVS